LGAPRDPWWKHACALQQAPADARRAAVPDESKRSQLARIAGLKPAVGAALDALHAPLRVYKYVAYAPASMAVPLELAQAARHQAIQAFLDKAGHWPLPHEMKEVEQLARARWYGMGPSPLAPSVASPRAMAMPRRAPSPVAAPVMATPPPPPPPPSQPTTVPLHHLSPITAMRVAEAIAPQDPVMAKLVMALAGRPTA
jgi:hypothetical protein